MSKTFGNIDNHLWQRSSAVQYIHAVSQEVFMNLARTQAAGRHGRYEGLK